MEALKLPPRASAAVLQYDSGGRGDSTSDSLASPGGATTPAWRLYTVYASLLY